MEPGLANFRKGHFTKQIRQRKSCSQTLSAVLLALLYVFLLGERVLGATAVYLWGSQSSAPPGLTNAVSIASGHGHSLALKREGRVIRGKWRGPPVTILKIKFKKPWQTNKPF